MKITDAKVISEYQVFFDDLYGNTNKDRDWQEIYGYLSRTTGYLTRAVLKGSVSSQEFARPIAWLSALATKLDIDLQSSFYKKYPSICHYCLEEVCCCFRTDKQPKTYRPPHKLIEERKTRYTILGRFDKQSFDAAVKNIMSIYPNNEVVWHFSGPWMNCSKLFEEIAELHESICKYYAGVKSKSHVEEEFGDVLAWILSAWVSTHRDKNLDEEIVSYFYHGCPVCKMQKCSCGKYDSRIQGVVDPKRYNELRTLFEQLEKVSPDAKTDIESLILALKSVEENQDEATALATTVEAKSVYTKLQEKLDKTEAVTTTLASIGKIISNVSDVL
ncbi:MazG nucleotide pyrophosphohydrolase domain-containing protein [Photobacterium lutimaris]|uniref:MazG nucleotide pyrophosphohydrolase domain-containing protein n=1 Tax=Photobacterium lutimaris TaxID=388278 RepID=UPI0014152FF9|nr:MazG nucleotide pyrophosphohydrolase domain-containing protein [Photobacterium lutimaris]